MSSTRHYCSICLEEGCEKNMLDVCCEVTSCDEYVAMVKTEKRLSAQPTRCHTVICAARSL